MKIQIQPYQTRLAFTHMNWLEEMRPARLEQLYSEDKLKDYLVEVVHRAEWNMEKLIEAGRREDEALEVVTATILAPEVSDDWSPKPLKSRLLKQIWASLGR